MRAASIIRGAWAQSQQFQVSAQRVISSSVGLQGLHSLSGEEQQQQQSLSLFQGPRPSLSALLGQRKMMPGGLTQSLTQSRNSSSSPPTGGQVEGNSWTKYREASGGIARPNSLGGAYYALIMVFGFGAFTKDLYAYPPRVLGVMGLVFIILYARRNT